MYNKLFSLLSTDKLGFVSEPKDMYCHMLTAPYPASKVSDKRQLATFHVGMKDEKKVLSPIQNE